MLTFLRKIRKSLIETGAARKYLLYAIGEILLVMVGILLALQINNWNEHQKLLRYEDKMLQEVVEDLQRDTSYLNRQFQRIEWMTKSNDILLRKPDYHDTLQQYLNVPSGVYFLLNKKAIESIRNSGQPIPLNDDLRKQIDEYYHRTQFLLDLIDKAGSTYFYPAILPFWNEHFISVPDIKAPDGSKFDTTNLDEVLKSPRFIDLVLSKKSRAKDWNDSYKQIYHSAVACMDAIQTYLDKK